MTASASQARLLPEIKLLCRFDSASEAFKDAVQQYYPDLLQCTTITILNNSLASLSPEVRFDAVVSPANSFGFMDGAFDDAISVMLSPNRREGYPWTTKKVQSTLYAKQRGFAPPGSCTIVDIQRDQAWNDIKAAEESVNATRPAFMREALASQEQQQARDDGAEHKHGCKYIALCPTMRVPQDVRWDREVIFECIWSLLCAIEAHNGQHEQDPKQQIKSILMTPLATGVGKVSDAKWAAQCVLAIKCWVDAVTNPEKWSSPHWDDTDSGSWASLSATN